MWHQPPSFCCIPPPTSASCLLFLPHFCGFTTSSVFPHPSSAFSLLSPQPAVRVQCHMHFPKLDGIGSPKFSYATISLAGLHVRLSGATHTSVKESLSLPHPIHTYIHECIQVCTGNDPCPLSMSAVSSCLGLCRSSTSVF